MRICRAAAPGLGLTRAQARALVRQQSEGALPGHSAFAVYHRITARRALYRIASQGRGTHVDILWTSRDRLAGSTHLVGCGRVLPDRFKIALQIFDLIVAPQVG